jgi:hypothetical protein
VNTLSISPLKRLMTLSLATVALASFAPARTAQAASVPFLVGQSFELHSTPNHDGQDAFKVTWEDTQGNLLVEVTQSGRKVIGAGTVKEALGTIGGTLFTMQYEYSPGVVYRYEGTIRQWGAGIGSDPDSEWMVAGSFSFFVKAAYLTVGPRPFCATSKSLQPPVLAGRTPAP